MHRRRGATKCVHDEDVKVLRLALFKLALHDKAGVTHQHIGLGLAIAAELVRGHGGRLDLMRSDAGGTDFVIRLPKTLGTAEAIS